MLTERTTTLFVSIFYFQKCQTRDYNKKSGFRPFYSSCTLYTKSDLKISNPLIACMRFRRGRPEQGVPLRIL